MIEKQVHTKQKSDSDDVIMIEMDKVQSKQKYTPDHNNTTTKGK